MHGLLLPCVFCGIVAMAINACDGSTAPEPETPAQLARHIDSLSIAASASGDGGRAAFLEQAEEAPGLGVTPVSVTVAINSASQVWQGYMWKIGPGPGLQGADSLYFVAAYSDYAFTSLIVARESFSGSDVGSQVGLVTTDATYAIGGFGTITASTIATGGSCVVATGLGNYPNGFDNASCVLGVMNGSVNWTFPSNVTGGPAVAIIIAEHQFNGVTFSPLDPGL
jgi:hypothetical protein